MGGEKPVDVLIVSSNTFHFTPPSHAAADTKDQGRTWSHSTLLLSALDWF